MTEQQERMPWTEAERRASREQCLYRRGASDEALRVVRAAAPDGRQERTKHAILKELNRQRKLFLEEFTPVSEDAAYKSCLSAIRSNATVRCPSFGVVARRRCTPCGWWCSGAPSALCVQIKELALHVQPH